MDLESIESVQESLVMRSFLIIGGHNEWDLVEFSSFLSVLGFYSKKE